MTASYATEAEDAWLLGIVFPHSAKRVLHFYGRPYRGEDREVS